MRLSTFEELSAKSAEKKLPQLERWQANMTMPQLVEELTRAIECNRNAVKRIAELESAYAHLSQYADELQARLALQTSGVRLGDENAATFQELLEKPITQIPTNENESTAN
jgi:hypothetical protein